MSEVRVYRCPACGAPASEDTRHCAYCRAPVASVRCARCFHMNPHEARHCSGCGDVLGLEPLSQPGELPCPACQTQLHGVDSEPGELLDCPNCGGQFIEHRKLRALLERRETLGRAVPNASPAPNNPLKQKVVYRACPACQQLMNRKNFGGQSGIIVDVCARHGTWFDQGELPSVLAFVEAGGLQRAAANASVKQASPTQAPPRARFSWDDPELVTDLDLGLVAGELLAYLVNALKR